ncbi:MAG: hypothetical protein AAGA30_01405 [Planctomycetota bacterium]
MALVSIVIANSCNLPLKNYPSQIQEPSKPDNQSEMTVKIGGIDWYQDYDQAMIVAKKENKPIWLHFGENPG